jgi:hypothetical protein
MSSDERTPANCASSTLWLLSNKEVREHVVGITLDGVVDVLLQNTVPFGQALQDLAQLGLGRALVGVKLFQTFPRIRTTLEGARFPPREAGCPSMHQRPQDVDARPQFSHFLRDVLVLPGLRDREDSKVMDRGLQVIDQGRLVFRRVGGSGSQPVARYDDIAHGLFEFVTQLDHVRPPASGRRSCGAYAWR